MITIKKVSAEEFADCFVHTDYWLRSFNDAACPGEYLGFKRDFYAQLIKHNLGLILVAFDGDKPIGWCGGYLSNDTYRKHRLLLQESIFVLPEYRQSKTAGKLMLEFERQAEMLPDCRGVLWTAHPDTAFDRLLKRHYRLFSNNYIKEF